VALSIEVSGEPKIPEHPVALAQLSFVSLSFIVALALGVGIVASIEALDTSVHSLTELEKLAPMPVLGAVEQINTKEEIRNASKRNLFIALFLLAIVILSDLIIRIFLFYV